MIKNMVAKSGLTAGRNSKLSSGSGEVVSQSINPWWSLGRLLFKYRKINKKKQLGYKKRRG